MKDDREAIFKALMNYALAYSEMVEAVICMWDQDRKGAAIHDSKAATLVASVPASIIKEMVEYDPQLSSDIS